LDATAYDAVFTYGTEVMSHAKTVRGNIRV